MSTQENATFNETWAIIELMGHQVIAGTITEVTIAGCAMLRVDVPPIKADLYNEALPAYTKFFNPSAIYGITPTDEMSAKHAALQLRKRPVALYILPAKAIAAPQEDFDEEPPF